MNQLGIGMILGIYLFVVAFTFVQSFVDDRKRNMTVGMAFISSVFAGILWPITLFISFFIKDSKINKR